MPFENIREAAKKRLGMVPEEEETVEEENSAESNTSSTADAVPLPLEGKASGEPMENDPEALPEAPENDGENGAEEPDFLPVEEETPVEGVPSSAEDNPPAPQGDGVEDEPSDVGEEPDVAAVMERLERAEEMNRQLGEQNEKLAALVQKLSQGNEEAVTDELTEPDIDWDNIMYEDPETARGQLAAYREAIAARERQAAQAEIMAKMRPALEDIEAQKAAMAHKAMMDRFNADPNLPGYGEMSPYLEAFVRENPNLYGNVSPEEAYINAYLAKRGYDALHAPAPAEPTDEELLAYYASRPGFKAAVEEARVKELNASGGDKVPVFAPSQGIGGAAAELQKKPKNWEEAGSAAKRRIRDRI